tara:strand:+ start:36 stop:536 length:501 start_codon:yes stop_codon:yes gene_type:complete
MVKNMVKDTKNDSGYIYALSMGSEDHSIEKLNALRVEYITFKDLLIRGYHHIDYIGMSYDKPNIRLAKHQSSKEWLINGCKSNIAKVMNLDFEISNKFLFMNVLTDWSFSIEQWPECDHKEKECILKVKEIFGFEPIFNTPAGLGIKQIDYLPLKKKQVKILEVPK